VCVFSSKRTADDKDCSAAAVTTNNQFAALLAKLEPRSLISEVVSLPHFGGLKPARNYNFDEVKKWAVNGWNTERILGLTEMSLSSDALQSALQWGFPQAYYSAFTLMLAFFKVVGHTESTHTTVIKKFGSLVDQGKYPQAISFLATGYKPFQFHGVTFDNKFSTLIKPDNPTAVEKQIALFLSGTRKQDLVEKKMDFRLQTKAGKKKRHFTPLDWQRVSEGLGNTSLLSLLYRKRIKANYREIDTFLNPHIDGANLFLALHRIVFCLNLVHEAFIAKSVGKAEYKKLTSQVSSGDFHFVAARESLIDPFL